MGPGWFDVRQKAREWTEDEFDARLDAMPEKIECSGGIFVSDEQRMTVLGMLLENLGMERAVRFGRLEDWEAVVAARRERQLKRG